MEERINRATELINRFREEASAFYADANSQVLRGNKAAGLRARNIALDLIGELKEFRRLSIELAKK